MDQMFSRKISFLAMILVSVMVLVTGASANILSIENGQVSAIGESTSLAVILDSAPDGLAGYNISVSIEDPSVAVLTGVSYPSWVTIKYNSTFPSTSCWLKGLDLAEQIQAGAEDINLATVTIQGLKAGSAPVTLSVTLMNEDGGARMYPNIQDGVFTVDMPVAPTAAFTATPVSGEAPLTVTFTDQSTNTPTAWRWAYKNATAGGWIQFATTQNPTFEFPAGIYDINLTATNSAGSDDEIKTGHVTVTSTASYIDVSTSGGVDSWNFQTGSNENSGSVDLTVDTNMPSWAVAASDALDDGKPAVTAGRMAEWSGTAYVNSGRVLAHAIEVKKVGEETYMPLSVTGQNILVGTAPATVSHDLVLRQTVEAIDPAPDGTNTYRIVITFTGVTL
jgi:PKD repeat protein